VTLVLLTSSDSSHSEIAIIDTVSGLVCAMFVGDAPNHSALGKRVCRMSGLGLSEGPSDWQGGPSNKRLKLTARVD